MSLLKKNINMKGSAFPSKCNIYPYSNFTAYVKLSSDNTSLTYEQIVHNAKYYLDLYVNDELKFTEINSKSLAFLYSHLSARVWNLDDKLEDAKMDSLIETYLAVQKLDAVVDEWLNASVFKGGFENWMVSDLLQLYNVILSKDSRMKLKKLSLRKLKNHLFKLNKNINEISKIEYIALFEIKQYLENENQTSAIKTEALQNDKILNSIKSALKKIESSSDIPMLNPFSTLEILKK